MSSPPTRCFALGILITLTMLVIAGITTYSEEGVEGNRLMAGPRMVFVEDITATWCGACPAVSEGLKDLSYERNDFRFITLVDDRVEDANERRMEYNIGAFPTVVFDGGYDEQVGSVSSGDEYNDNIDNCLDRETPDISMEVEAFDVGGSELSIEVVVNNNENENYDGILKVMIVEVVSRYLDADGNNYPNSMLGYAIDGDVSIGAGEQQTFTETWIGADVEDMLGDDFGDIDQDNIVIYAAMFNAKDNYKTRMGVPPTYYVANYCDNVAEGFPVEVGDAPTVEITSPRDGRTVSDLVRITAEVTSEADIETVEVKIGQDSWMDMTLSGAEYIFEWDTIDERNGEIGISVKAIDDQGLTGIDNIDVTVENEGAPTTPEIDSLTHLPVIPDDTQKIKIRVDLILYDTSISSAQAVICLDETCLPPKDMTELSEDSFELEVGPYDAGQEITYHVVIEDTEGNTIQSQEKSFTIKASQQPTPSDDDDSVTDDDDGAGDVQSSGGQTQFIIAGAFIALIILVVLIIIFALSRSGRSERKTQPIYNDRSSQGYVRQLADDDLELETDVRVK